MADVEKMVGGFRSVIQDLVVPEFKALQVEIRGLGTRIDKLDTRLDKHDDKFEKIISEMHEGFKKSDERFLQMVGRLTEIESSMKIIVERLNSKERVDDIDYRLRKIEEKLEIA